ncbi:hypothetical protein SAMN04487786_1135 [Paenisporosarcina quisquiliarum]|nr:hypothetical protein SAMN04487786_1135 [Paenisporosarcina quisquiliarum]
MILLVSELLSFDKDNPIMSITGVAFSLGTVVTVVITLAIYLMKNLVLDSFDIKLLHKNSHTGIKIAKSITSISLIALYFFGVDWYLYFVIKQFSGIDIILLFVVIIYLLLYSLSSAIFGVYKLIYKIKERRFVSQPPQTGGIFNTFINNFSNIFILSTAFLLMLISTFLLVVLDAAGEELEYLIGVSFLFSLIPSIAIFFYKPNRTKRYELSEILTDPIEIVARKLVLEYSIDKTSSVLSNKEDNIVAVKHNHDGNYSVEIYDVIEIYQTTSEQPVTPTPMSED